MKEQQEQPKKLQRTFSEAEIIKAFDRAGQKISPVDVSLYYGRKDLTPVIHNELGLITEMLNIAQFYYGIKPETAKGSFSSVTVDYILTNFKTFTVEDVLISFKRMDIEKVKGVSLTVKEFTQPLKEWRNICGKIKSMEDSIYQSEVVEAKRKEESLKAYKEQRAKAFGMFNDLTEAGAEEWEGTIYDALSISKEVTKRYVTIEEKNEIFRSVLREEEERKKDKVFTVSERMKVESFYKEILETGKATFEVRAKCAKKAIDLTLKRIKQLKTK